MPATIDQADPQAEPIGSDATLQDGLYQRVATEFASPLARLVRAHEADASLQQDLLQEIHIALWRSLAAFGERCSLRTWVYRVAHNVAATHVLRGRRRARGLVDIDHVEPAAPGGNLEAEVDQTRTLEKLRSLIQQLKPLDRQLIILHLEGLAGEDIADICGLSIANTATKLHRIRQLLAARFGTGESS
jgi:RNA polymerase sigma-70 factor (ECF subfamily)